MMLSGKSQKIILDEFSFLISTTEVKNSGTIETVNSKEPSRIFF